MSETIEQGGYLPTGEFVWRQPVRAYEPASNGRMGPGNMLRYCELVANAASAAAGYGTRWYTARGETWVVFRQTIELATPVGVAESLDLMTWVRSYSRVSAQRDYRLLHASTGMVVARGTTTWAYVDQAQQAPRRIPAELTDNLPGVARVALPQRSEWGSPPVIAPAEERWDLRARSYEADTWHHVNNCVYADWLTEAATLAIAAWSQTTDRDLATLCQRDLWPRRLHMTYHRSARPGDLVTVVTTLQRLATRGLVIGQRIFPHDDASQPLLSATAWFLG